MRYREYSLGESQEPIEKFTSSIKEDIEFLPETIHMLKTHIAHLENKGIIPREKGEKIINMITKPSFIKELMEFVKDNYYEDIHEAIEDFLYKKIGEDALYIPLGRSRNDHVAAIIRLHLVKKLYSLLEKITLFAEELIKKSIEHIDSLFILHTHFQPAQTTSYAHYLLSIVEELLDIASYIVYSIEMTLKSPLGSCAGVGTLVPLDRKKLAIDAGFKQVIHNTLYATSSRGFFIPAASAIAWICTLLTRISTDYISWSHPSINLIIPPTTHIQTSSIMPHKRNPATMELVRAKCTKIATETTNVIHLQSKITTGYNLDLQELTPILWKMIKETEETINITKDFILNTNPNNQAIKQTIKKYITGITEVAEYISQKRMLPYRKVHQEIGELLRKNDWNHEKTLSKLEEKYNLKIKHLIEPKNQNRLKKTLGSPNPQKIRNMTKHFEKQLRNIKSSINKIIDRNKTILLQFPSRYNK